MSEVQLMFSRKEKRHPLEPRRRGVALLGGAQAGGESHLSCQSDPEPDTKISPRGAYWIHLGMLSMVCD